MRRLASALLLVTLVCGVFGPVTAIVEDLCPDDAEPDCCRPDCALCFCCLHWIPAVPEMTAPPVGILRASELRIEADRAPAFPDPRGIPHVPRRTSPLDRRLH